MKKYFYSNGQEKEGPVTLEELKLVNLQPTTLIWHEGLNDWTPAGELVEITSVFELSPPFISSDKSDGASELVNNTGKSTMVNDVQLKNKSVGGWLVVLCIILTFIGPARTLLSLITTYNAASKYFEQLPRLEAVLYVDSFLAFCLMILSINAGSALWNIKPRAVIIAKNYFFIFLGYTVIWMFLPFTLGLPTTATEHFIAVVTDKAFSSLIYFGVWYSYLKFSKRVKATYIS